MNISFALDALQLVTPLFAEVTDSQMIMILVYLVVTSLILGTMVVTFFILTFRLIWFLMKKGRSPGEKTGDQELTGGKNPNTEEEKPTEILVVIAMFVISLALSNWIMSPWYSYSSMFICFCQAISMVLGGAAILVFFRLTVKYKRVQRLEGKESPFTETSVLIAIFVIVLALCVPFIHTCLSVSSTPQRQHFHER